MEPGELGEPTQGKKLLALSSRKEPVLERGEDQEERCLDQACEKLVLSQERGTWYRVFKGSANDDGCLRWLLFQGSGCLLKLRVWRISGGYSSHHEEGVCLVLAFGRVG